MVPAHQVQTQIQARRTAGTREDVAVVDVQDVGVGLGSPNTSVTIPVSNGDMPS
jgi:hypothetical protein